MIDKNKLLNKAIGLGSTKTIEDLDNILIDLNIDELISKKQEMFKLVIWDKKSKINGISAGTILESKTYEIDQVYLIYVNDKLVYMQDHTPNESGFVTMSKDKVVEIGTNFITEKAEQLVLEEIYNIVIKKMLE